MSGELIQRRLANLRDIGAGKQAQPHRAQPKRRYVTVAKTFLLDVVAGNKCLEQAVSGA